MSFDSPESGGGSLPIRGTAPSGDPIAIKTDTSGNLIVSGTVVADLADIENVTVRQATPTNLKTSVSGADASGDAPSQPPVLVAGSDGTNVRTLATTPTGLLKVEIADVTEGPPLLTEGVIDAGQDAVANAVKPLLVGGVGPGNLLRSLLVRDDGTLSLPSDSLAPKAYDFISLGYTGSTLTGVVFRSGGAAGTIVSTLTLAYSGDLLISVTRS